MENLEVPDRLIPCDNLTTTQQDQVVKLRRTDDPFDKLNEPMSVPGFLKNIATTYPNTIALISKDQNGDLNKYTFKEYEDAVRICAKAFLKLGLKRFHSVCILGFNSPEWFISNLGAIYAGGIACGIYITNISEACWYIAKNSGANIIVVENEKQLQKILDIKSRLPDLKQIIQYRGEPKHQGVLSWKELMELGTNQSDEELDNVLKTIAANQCCTMVYTSGTTGIPKGAMLTHDNLIYDAKCLCERLHVKMGNETVVSYLPLSHIAAQIVDIYLMTACAGTIYFADESALKGALVNILLQAKPTRFLGVPRVWEKIREKMMEIGANNGYLKSFIIGWAKTQGYRHNFDITNGIEKSTWSYQLANELVFKKIKQSLGFERCITYAVAAAPLSDEVKKFFFCLDIPIIEAFGLSEVAAHTLGTLYKYEFNCIGEPLITMQTKIANQDADGNGEICLYGRHVFMGYLGNPAETKICVDEKGWFHTGDIGRLDDKGLLYITGRLKEMIITAGGENVSPVQIEQRILENMTFISNAIVIGDKRKFLSVLLTLRTEIDIENMPMDILTKPIQGWLNELGSEATTVTQVLAEGPHLKVKEAIQEGLDKINIQAISNAQKIQKYIILPRDFSIPGGELGPTLKLKRNVIINKYKSVIDELYS